MFIQRHPDTQGSGCVPTFLHFSPPPLLKRPSPTSLLRRLTVSEASFVVVDTDYGGNGIEGTGVGGRRME